MHGTVETFQKQVNELPESLADKHRVHYKVWIVSVPFFAMQYLNETRYLPGDSTPSIERW